MRVRHFLPVHIYDDTVAPLMSWHTVPRGAEVQDLDEILSS